MDELIQYLSGVFSQEEMIQSIMQNSPETGAKLTFFEFFKGLCGPERFKQISSEIPVKMIRAKREFMGSMDENNPARDLSEIEFALSVAGIKQSDLNFMRFIKMNHPIVLMVDRSIFGRLAAKLKRFNDILSEVNYNAVVFNPTLEEAQSLGTYPEEGFPRNDLILHYIDKFDFTESSLVAAKKIGDALISNYDRRPGCHSI